MSPKEHAEIWRKAAAVVAGMDPMQRLLNRQAAVTGGTYQMGSEFGQAYRAAASVLRAIAVVLVRADVTSSG